MADGRQRRVSIASVAGERPGERRGWFLKKAKTSSSWAKAHHSHRYFVALGHALSYYDGMADSPQASAALRGVIDLREVKRVRPSGETALAPAKIFFLSLTRSLLSALSLSRSRCHRTRACHRPRPLRSDVCARAAAGDGRGARRVGSNVGADAARGCNRAGAPWRE